jgi:hypothetical protein
MDELKAREILGCSSSASYKEIKSAYRRMIVMVHPDKAGHDSISQERAKEASSRLNQAFEYLENREKLGVLGKAETHSRTGYEPPRGRATRPHECDICGFAPATRISAPMVTSFVYFIRRGKYELNACKDCGTAMTRIALRDSMVKGWWGLGIFFMPNIIYRYFKNVQILKRIDRPSFRDPEVVTLSQYPFRVPPSPFRETMPLVTSAIALLILGSVFFGGGSSSDSVQSDYFGQIGTCYKEVYSSEGDKVGMVDCTDADATLKSIAVTEGVYLCPTGTLFTTEANLPDGTVKTACLQSK